MSENAEVIVPDSSFFKTQWGVIQKIKGDKPELMPQLNWSRKDAEGYRQWLQIRDAETEARAMDEERHRFPDGNHNYFIWHRGFGMRALKDASYHLAARQVSDWSEINE